ncbi:hypothetical protein [Paenibacillus elgii]|uniref:hypothetical protein n=1 Tax=Paenibacillus elgii TaxID=189691 RepID=UPI001F42CCE6|nr:hypothetical protein [Paenibacillus elgii]
MAQANRLGDAGINPADSCRFAGVRRRREVCNRIAEVLDTLEKNHVSPFVCQAVFHGNAQSFEDAVQNQYVGEAVADVFAGSPCFDIIVKVGDEKAAGKRSMK